MSLREALEHALSVCTEDEAYQQYSAREKYLALTYTYIQTIQKEQNKFVPVLSSRKNFILPNDEILRLKAMFIPYAKQLIDEGTQNGEIVLRPLLHNVYTTMIWQSFLQVLHFWVNDQSSHKAETDVIVEKTIHFVFDALAPNAIDSGLDYLKFLIQKRPK